MTETVFITGASSGLGRQMAVEFAQRGYHLALCARRLDSLMAIKQELSQLPVDVECWQCDVNNEAQLQATLGEAERRFATIDKIIVNAGMANFGQIGVQSFSEMKAMIALNLTAAMATAHYGVQLFRRQGRGHMVFVSSLAGLRGLPGMGGYSASKAGLRFFADVLRAETYRENIDVTVLCPGYINTPLGDDMDQRPFVISAEKGGRLLTNLIEKRVKRAYVPAWPWAILGRIIQRLPTALAARMPS